MGQLVAGLGLFIGAHALPMLQGLRSSLQSRFGVNGYLIAMALVSLAGMVLIGQGYGAAPYVEVWSPPRGLRHVSYLLMLPAFTLLIATYLPGQLRRFVRHPMLLAVKLWATAHLLANGDLASMLLFGGLLAWAVVDLISVSRRQRAAGVTPTLGPVRNDMIAVVAGLGLYALTVFWGHGAIIGVGLLG
ncbi:MAG: NnrU family protein [Pseudomonadota bacterium]